MEEDVRAVEEIPLRPVPLAPGAGIRLREPRVQQPAGPQHQEVADYFPSRRARSISDAGSSDFGSPGAGACGAGVLSAPPGAGSPSWRRSSSSPVPLTVAASVTLPVTRPGKTI